MDSVSPVRVLFLQQQPSIYQRAQAILDEDGGNWRLCDLQAQDAPGASLADLQPGLLLIDSAAAVNIEQILPGLRREAPGLPVIVLGDGGDEALVVRCIKAGAADFVSYQHLSRLPDAAREALVHPAPGSPVDDARLSDIIDQKAGHNEQRLRELTDQYRSLLQTTLDGFIIIGIDGKIIDANAIYCQMTGYTHEELLELTVSDLDYDEGSAETKAHIQQLLEAGSARFEARHRKKDGQVLEVEISTTYVPSQQNFLTFCQDISSQKRYLQELRESEARFKAVSEYSNVAICLIDHCGRIIWANQSMARVTGFSLEQIYAAESFLEFVAPESLEFITRHFMKFTRNEPYEKDFTFQLLRPDGERRLGETHVTDYVDRQGQRILAVGLVDITEQRQAETRIKEQIEELQRWYRITLGREGRILELKREVNQLLTKAGEPPRYLSAADELMG